MSAGERGALRTFGAVCLAQNVSLFGSQLTGFSLGVWLYERTGSAMFYGLVSVANVAPLLLVAPLAGVVIDRWDRRRALLAGEIGAGACSLIMAALFQMGALAPWTILLFVTLASGFGTLYSVAFSAVTPTLVPPPHLGRANGLLQLGASLTAIVAPGAAGLLLHALGLGGVLAIDVASFLFAIGVLLAVRFPQPAEARAEGRRSAWREVGHGLRYLRERPGLLGLLVFTVAVNFNLGMVQVLLTPLVLAFADSRALGTVLSASAAGMLMGSITMLALGVPRHRAQAVLGFVLLQALFLCASALRPSTGWLSVCAFGALFALSLVGGCSEIIWQCKVPEDLRGRITAVRAVIVGASLPIALLTAGPLCDRVAEPLMARDGLLAGSVGQLLGTGPGRGAALLFVVLGGLTIASVIAGYLYPPLRRLEEEQPDLEAVPLPDPR